MKNTTTKFIAIIAMFVTGITTTFAQAGLFPNDWNSYGQQNFKFVRTESVGNGMFKDVYMYIPSNSEVSTSPFLCSTCGKTAPVTPINNSNNNTNINYDVEMEAKKLAADNYFRSEYLKIEKMKLEQQDRYIKMLKRQGIWKGITDFFMAGGSVMSGTGQIMQGKAALDGLYQDNIYIVNGNNPVAPNQPTDWNYGTPTTPVNPVNPTSPTDWGFGTVTTTPTGQTPPIYNPAPTDWN